MLLYMDETSFGNINGAFMSEENVPPLNSSQQSLLIILSNQVMRQCCACYPMQLIGALGNVLYTDIAFYIGVKTEHWHYTSIW